ncbi:MAG: molybdopterin-dependent oxidoreductase [Epsilonproteobacteria bacterium]|nr:molybdopterin-dependent oxidoreductase [Campylobacterota bacterium]
MRIDSVCTYCGVGCDIYAEVENNRIESIKADPKGIVSRGKLCVKGKYGFDFVHSPNRLPKAKIKYSFLMKNLLYLPKEIKKEIDKLSPKEGYVYPSLDLAYKIAAWKLKQIKDNYGGFAHASIGGARTSCESGYIFQKFTRKVINSPHIDNCARVCHAPSLKGMRAVIGEGAATNPFDDIEKAEFLVLIGANMTEAHPIAAARVVNSVNRGVKLAVFDIREIALFKIASYKAVLPYESNLLFLNMLAYVILQEELYDKSFIERRCEGFEEYKEEILKDPFANPDFFKKIKGYEYLSDLIREVAREYASKKSMIMWGLGVTENIDGSYAVSAICNLALLTGNIGKEGAGLMPLRGQNNVQGACDMGCLPYYDPDYEKPFIEGLKTPDIIKAIEREEIKSLYVMGEDIAHIHPNQNRIHKALEKLELLIVNELFDNEITKYADIVFGVKSAYEKEGVYVNAERRLHLSKPLVKNDLPDDWEVISGIGRLLREDFVYESSKEVWEEVRNKVSKRFKGASYEKLEENISRGLQWPVFEEDTPILHKERFRTADGKGHFKYKRYFLRGMVKELLEGDLKTFYLSTGRVISLYNNNAQTKESKKLLSRYEHDLLFVSKDDEEFFKDRKSVVLISRYGRSAPLKIKITSALKKGTLFTTFHHPQSKINYLFGDDADELTKTACFKSLKVFVE